MARRANGLLLPIGVATILTVTLWPVAKVGPDTGELLSARLQLYPVDLVLNVLLFAPLGALLAHWRTGAAVAAAVGLTVFIELNQIWLPGRVPSPWDVAANVMGAWAGHGVAAAVGRHGLQDERLRRRAYVTWTLASVVALLAAPLGFRTAPPDSPWYAHLPPDVANLERYAGSIERVALNGVPLRHGRIQEPLVVDALHAAHVVDVDAVTGSAPERLAGLFLVTDGTGDEVAMIGLRGRDLMYRVATAGMAFGLEYPQLWWPDALLDEPIGRPFSVTARLDGASLCLAVDGRERCDRGPRLEDGWQHWLPAQLVDARTRALLDRAWLVVVFLPLGVGLRARPLPLACVTAALGAAAVGPWLGPIAPIGPGAALSIGLSLAGGWVLGVLHRRAGQAPYQR